MEDNREIEIDFRKLFSMLKRKAAFIVLIALIGATLAGCITNFFIKPQYTASVKMHAWSNSDNLLTPNNSISLTEYQASEMLVNTYLVVITSDNFLETVANEMGNDMTSSKIKSMLSCSQIQDTIAFRISVTSTDPEEAANVANKIAEVCPRELVRIMKVGGVEVIDYAKTPTKPSSPNLEKNILIGFLAGFALSFAVFFIKELFNTSISDESDLMREFSIPIIGTVPKLLPITDHSKLEHSTAVDPPQPSMIIQNQKEDK